MPRSLWNLYALCYDLIAGLVPYQDMLDRVVQALELSPGMRVLDAGCGTGALAEKVARACPQVELIGLDHSASMLRRARTRRVWPASFVFLEGDLDDLLARDRAGFDRIASVNVIWALPDPQRTLSGMTRALRPGGHMVHATPRLRFAAQRIAWEHIRRQRGWKRFRAVASLPLLGLAGLLNLVLVAASLLRPSARHRGKRWSTQGLKTLVQASGACVTASEWCYGGQAHLLVCGREGTPSSGLPALPKDL